MEALSLLSECGGADRMAFESYSKLGLQSQNGVENFFITFKIVI